MSIYFVVALLSDGLSDVTGGVIFAIGTLAFSPLFWQYAITAEVFALNNLFAAAIVYLTVLFTKMRQIPIALLGAFVCGLAICNQHTIILFEIPLILWTMVLLRKRVYRNPWLVIQLSFCFIAGLLPYSYLPYIATHAPKQGSWGHLVTLQGLIHHFLRRDYGTFKLYSGNSLDQYARTTT
jgi:hypothetical protein